MSKSYEKYLVQNPQSSSGKSYEKYIVTAPIQEQKGDSWPALIGKSALKGLTSIVDLPQTIGSLAEKVVMPTTEPIVKLYDYLAGNPYSESRGRDVISSLPSVSSKAREAIKEYGDVDLEPHPSTAGQRIAGEGAEFAGAMFNPSSIATKGNLLQKFLGTAKNLSKDARLGASIGATSGALQEGDINPLAANLIAAGTIPTISAGSKNLLNKFSSSHKQTKAKQRVKKALTKQIGEENVPAVLENIQKYKRQKKPLNVQLTTPEVAQDVGLSRLYRTQSNSPAIAERYKQNDLKLLEALERLGTTGLPESVKGEAIRNPFFENFNKKIKRREELTRPLYEELEAIQSGIEPNSARSLLDKEIAVSSPGNRAPLDKYRKNLVRNEADPVIIEQIKEIQNSLKNIDKQYKDLNPNALEQLKAPLKQELAELETLINPRPIQIENTIQELGDKVNAYSRTGEKNAARKYGAIKKAYEEDLAKSPSGLKHREEYRRLSEPINEIEKSSLLNNFVKKNTDVSKLEGFVAPSEKIPELILNADLNNTKILMNKAKGNRELLDLIKGTYLDKLLETSQLKSGNLSYDKASKFLDNKYNKEKLKVIFNNKEQKIIDQYLDTLKKRNKVESMGKVSGSDTHQKLKVDNEFNDELKGLGLLAEKGLLKASGTGKIGELGIGALKNVGKKIIPQTPYIPVLEDVLLNPNSFKKLMTDQHRTKTFRDFYNPLPLLIGTNLGMRQN